MTHRLILYISVNGNEISIKYSGILRKVIEVNHNGEVVMTKRAISPSGIYSFKVIEDGEVIHYLIDVFFGGPYIHTRYIVKRNNRTILQI